MLAMLPNQDHRMQNLATGHGLKKDDLPQLSVFSNEPPMQSQVETPWAQHQTSGIPTSLNQFIHNQQAQDQVGGAAAMGASDAVSQGTEAQSATTDLGANGGDGSNQQAADFLTGLMMNQCRTSQAQAPTPEYINSALLQQQQLQQNNTQATTPATLVAIAQQQHAIAQQQQQQLAQLQQQQQQQQPQVVVMPNQQQQLEFLQQQQQQQAMQNQQADLLQQQQQQQQQQQLLLLLQQQQQHQQILNPSLLSPQPQELFLNQEQHGLNANMATLQAHTQMGYGQPAGFSHGAIGASLNPSVEAVSGNQERWNRMLGSQREELHRLGVQQPANGVGSTHNVSDPTTSTVMTSLMLSGVNSGQGNHVGLGSAGQQAKPQVLKPKKGKLKKEGPKRALTAYNYFFKDERARLLGKLAAMDDNETPTDAPGHTSADTKKWRRKHAHGKLGFKEMAQIIGQNWKKVNLEQLEMYKAKAKADKDRYEEEMKLWRIGKRSRET